MKAGMKRGRGKRRVIVVRWFKTLISVVFFALLPLQLVGQLVAPVASDTQDAQRSALRSVLGAGDNLCGQAMEISRSPDATMYTLRQNFEILSGQYLLFKNTLTPLQLNRAADQLADLDGGLNIIAQLFTTNQATSVQASQFNFLQTSRILNEAVREWCRQLKIDANSRMQIW